MCWRRRANWRSRHHSVGPAAKAATRNRAGGNAVQITLKRLAMPAVAILAAMNAAPGSAQAGKLSSCLAILDINARVACYDALARAEQSAQTNIREEATP